MSKALVDKQIMLIRIPGKGGWTYAPVEVSEREKGAPFGMMRVKGSIDNYEISGCSIMPMGDGKLFLPVNATIRKSIGKEEGDVVHVVLFKDEEPYKIPDELVTRLQEAGVYNLFLKHKQWEQRICAKRIFSAKRPETINERILKTIFLLKKNEKIV